jgi:hypothetical protein
MTVEPWVGQGPMRSKGPRRPWPGVLLWVVSRQSKVQLARVLASAAAAMTPTREQILAASAGWVAVLLNVVPGLGAGYLYQRRWKAYWITSALATAWFVAGAVLGQNADATAEAQNQLVGLIGLLALAGVTATEAGLAVKRVRNNG